MIPSLIAAVAAAAHGTNGLTRTRWPPSFDEQDFVVQWRASHVGTGPFRDRFPRGAFFALGTCASWVDSSFGLAIQLKLALHHGCLV